MPNLLDKKKAKAEYDQIYRARNRARISQRMKIYYKRLTPEQKAKRKAYRERSRDRAREYAAQYRSNNKEKISQTVKLWYENNKIYKNWVTKCWRFFNKGKSTAIAAKRRARLLNATPPWADLDAIRDFYVRCPAGYHVDHIVPLQGKLVSGLHVLENLQYLLASENMSKGNKYELA